MAIRLELSIDNPITPDELFTMVLRYPEFNLPLGSPRYHRKTVSGGLPIVESRFETPELSFYICLWEKDQIWREITYETCQVAPRIGLVVNYSSEFSDDPFCRLFAYILRNLEGDALMTFDGARPILRRKDGIILLREGTGYYSTEPLRSLLPPPITYGKIPW